jgi:RNA polymerase sigma factor (sigma-70 family)
LLIKIVVVKREKYIIIQTMAIAVETQVARTPREPSPALLAEIAAEAPFIAQVKAGGDDADDAFKQLYESSLPTVERNLRSITDTGIREETKQTVYMKAHQAIGRYEPIVPFRMWVGRIAYHEAINIHRERQRRPQTVGTIEEELDTTAAPQKTDEEALAHVRAELIRETLQEVLEKIPPKQQALLTARYLQEQPYQQIAEEKGIPVGSVASGLSRALKRAKRVFEAAGLSLADF